MDPSPPYSPEHKFELFLDAASDYAIFFTDTSGRITEWSRGAEKVIGYSEEEAQQLHARTIFTEEDQRRGVPEEEMASAARDGQANDERWHVRKGGKVFYAIGRMVALKDRDGSLRGFAKILRDATAHKRMEQALHASDQQLRAIFTQAPLALLITDLDGRIQQVNPECIRVTGYSADRLIGMPLSALNAHEDRPRMGELIDEMLAGKRQHRVLEKRLVRADGSFIWVQNSMTVLRDLEGTPFGLVVVSQDISVLKVSSTDLENLVNARTEALQAKTKQMESFCYTVAHDLRAPLRAIAGYAQLLEREYHHTLAPPVLDYVKRIDGSAGRLNALITDLLDYTRIQQKPLELQELEVTEIVRKVVEEVKREFEPVGFDVEIAAPLGRVHADPVTVERIFSNLVENAVKFRREGVRPELRIRSETTEGRVRFWVEDNGVGIDLRFRERIFGIFERLHPERRVPGTGVGLAIVATLVERLGGFRGVEANHPAGSRFWVELPQ